MGVSARVRAAGVRARGRWAAWWALLIAGIGAAVYLNSLGGAFVSDDHFLVLGHPHTRDAALMPDIFASGHYAGQGGYRPLVTLSFALNHLVGGVDPRGYHLVNVVLHALNSALVALLVLRLFDSLAVAGIAGLLFAVHPVHAEAVAWISGRAELMAAAMFLASWLLYLRATAGGRVVGWSFAAALAAFFLGMLCKEHVLVLPGALALTELLRARARGGDGPGRGRRLAWAVLWRCVAFASVVAGYFLFRGALYERPFMRMPSQIGYHDNPLVMVEPMARACTAVRILADYVRLLAWPRALSADYSFDQVPIASGPCDAGVMVAAATLAGLAGWGAISFLGRGRIWFGIALFFLCIVPTSNLLFLIGVIQAERLLYLPSVGFCIAAGILCAGWWDRVGRWPMARAALASLAGLAMAGLLTRTLARNADWRDEATLCVATAAGAPRSVKAQINLGQHWLKAGRVDSAIEAFRRALAIDPGSADATLNLGAALVGKGEMIEAITLYRQGVRAHPDCAAMHLNLGALEAGLGDGSGAEASFRRAVALAPDNAVARFNLGLALSRRGALEEALAEYRASVGADPGYPEAWNGMGAVLIKMGRLAEAREAIGRALSLRPDYPEASHNMRLIPGAKDGG